jgi:hypothetical protein
MFIFSFAVATAHFASAALIGPSLGYICASGGGCVGGGLSAFASAVLDFPLSYVKSLIMGLHDGHSYLAFAALNSAIWGAATWVSLRIAFKSSRVSG